MVLPFRDQPYMSHCALIAILSPHRTLVVLTTCRRLFLELTQALLTLATLLGNHAATKSQLLRLLAEEKGRFGWGRVCKQGPPRWPKMRSSWDSIKETQHVTANTTLPSWISLLDVGDLGMQSIFSRSSISSQLHITSTLHNIKSDSHFPYPIYTTIQPLLPPA